MNAVHQNFGDGHGHSHGDDGHGHGAPSHGTLNGYMVGFAASVLLTAVPFWLVMSHVFADGRLTAAAIMAFATAQIVVHMVCFLHMNTRSEGGWTMLALVFTLLLVVITLSGSMWVMFHLNHNMMPMSAAEMRYVP